MKQEFIDYLVKIELSEPIVKVIQDNYSKLIAIADITDFDDIFVSESREGESDRDYLNLWGFTPIMIGSITLSGKEISIVKIQNVISSFTVFDNNYDLITPSTNSKLNCYVKRIHVERSLVFKSSGINCNHLLNLSKKYFIKQINSKINS